MWRVKEHRDIEKTCRRLPAAVVKKYEIWKVLKNAKRQEGKGIIVELTTEQAAMLKKAVEKWQPQLIYGQINELFEEKEDPVEKAETKKK